MQFTLHQGDCIERLREYPDNSFDSCVTDPPYGLKFMSKHWDYDVPSVEIWRECLRVIKPGGHLLAFAGTRTHHRMTVNIEDAGFDIRDMIAWVYGSGMPKHQSSLKPAIEPITMARKPAKKATLLNIDACRVQHNDIIHTPQSDPSKRVGVVGSDLGISNADIEKFQAAQRESIQRTMELGRYPSNLIHDGSEEVVALFPDSDGAGPSLPNVKITGYGDGVVGSGESAYLGGPRRPFNSGTGSAARFFYQAKASRKDREDGLHGFPQQVSKSIGDGMSNVVRRCPEHDASIPSGGRTYSCGCKFQYHAGDISKPRANNHPTVKPTDLMRYLCRLVTPPGGIVLDPFAGSGSTGKAAMLEGFKFIGIEREAEYIDIANARILMAQIQAFDEEMARLEL